jgi:hypothetical protein
MFDPIFDDGHKVNRPCAFASAAMLDAWRHEQANLIRRLTIPERRHHIVVVVDGVDRREHTIGPAMPQEQLSAASCESTEVRIRQGHYSIVPGPSARNGRVDRVEIEPNANPIRILEDDVAKNSSC